MQYFLARIIAYSTFFSIFNYGPAHIPRGISPIFYPSDYTGFREKLLIRTMGVKPGTKLWVVAERENCLKCFFASVDSILSLSSLNSIKSSLSVYVFRGWNYRIFLRPISAGQLSYNKIRLELRVP